MHRGRLLLKSISSLPLQDASAYAYAYAYVDVYVYVGILRYMCLRLWEWSDLENWEGLAEMKKAMAACEKDLSKAYEKLEKVAQKKHTHHTFLNQLEDTRAGLACLR